MPQASLARAKAGGHARGPCFEDGCTVHCLARGTFRAPTASPANGGAGQTIAIVDAYDNPNAEADLAVYREQYGLPPCTTANGCFKKVDQRGGTDYPQPSETWAGEISLDLDMVSAAAPAAHILLVETDNDGWTVSPPASDKAVALGAKYVSNSYGRLGDLRTDLSTYGASYNHPGVPWWRPAATTGTESRSPRHCRP